MPPKTTFIRNGEEIEIKSIGDIDITIEWAKTLLDGERDMFEISFDGVRLATFYLTCTDFSHLTIFEGQWNALYDAFFENTYRVLNRYYKRKNETFEGK